MNLKINLILLFLLMLIEINGGQNFQTIINEKVHLTEEEMDQSNLSNDEESERMKQHSTYSYQQQNEQQHQESSDPNDMQITSAEIQTKKIHHPNFLIRNPIFNNQNSISKTNVQQHNQHILSKTRPIVTHNSHNSFTESDNQQVIQQQFDNEMDYQQSTSTQTPFSNSDSQIRDNNWPFSSASSTNNLVLASKPNSGVAAGEFTINSNTLNFTSNQGLDNLKVFNITATNHILPPVTFSNIVPATTNYNQQDPLSSHQIIANPIQNLVLRSFEYYRHLIKNCEPIENFLVTKMNLPKNKMLHSLDPLELNEPLYWSSRDNKTPMLGKLKFTLDFVQVNGLSTFKTENLSNQGRTLYFKHRIPQLEFISNYTVDYLLFDEVPLFISKGSLKALVPNAYIKGSFTVLPDILNVALILNVWFKIQNLNLSSIVDDVDVNVYPQFSISDRFRMERSTLNKLNTVIKNIIPNIVEYLKLTYSKAIEMKIV